MTSKNIILDKFIKDIRDSYSQFTQETVVTLYLRYSNTVYIHISSIFRPIYHLSCHVKLNLCLLVSNEARQEWVWHSPVGPGEIYNSASIRFEVVEEHFGDPSPTPTHAPTPTGGQPGAAATGTRVGATAAEEAGPTGPVQADILTNATCIPYYLEVSFSSPAPVSFYCQYVLQYLFFIRLHFLYCSTNKRVL